MRPFASFAMVALGVAACGHPGSPPSPSTPSSPSIRIDPANIERVRGELPPGYEAGDLFGRSAPATFWGLGPGWTADPAHCGALADPVIEPATTGGWSGSGPGGIVYVVVTGSPPAQVRLESNLIADCARWTVSGGHTSGSVNLVDAPAVDGAETVGMATVTTTLVEGGTETHSHADTFTAYLGGYVAFVTVVTDPGSPNPPLGQDFAAELLAKTVSALRS